MSAKESKFVSEPITAMAGDIISYHFVPGWEISQSTSRRVGQIRAVDADFSGHKQ